MLGALRRSRRRYFTSLREPELVVGGHSPLLAAKATDTRLLVGGLMLS